MERRLFLAIALSLLFIMAYSSIVTRHAPKPNLVVESQNPQATPPLLVESQGITMPGQQETTISAAVTPKEALKVLKNADLYLTIDPYGSGIQESMLEIYAKSLPQTNIGLLPEWQGKEFTFAETNLTDSITISYDDKNKGFEVKKGYKFTKDRYIIEITLDFITHSNKNSYIKYSLNVGSISEEILKKNSIEQRYYEISISLPSKILRNNYLKFNPKIVNEKIQWVGIRNMYLCSIIRPMQQVEQLAKSESAGLVSYLLQVPAFELPAGQTVRHTYLIYLGPQKQELISKLGLGAEDIVNFGLFDPLSHILLGALKLFYKVSKNWGIALILFSLAVFIIMSPLSIISFSSMKRMQELQPLIEELKVKYKDNPQKMHKETMELYRVKKINPFGGCLPLLLQMPIFIALYQALMRFINLNGAQFWWIKDLSQPDKFKLPSMLPMVGSKTFNLLPIIMIITMLVQQKLTAGKASQDASTAQQQKMMSLFMAVFFGIMFYSMPAGLVLYWTVNSILMLLFQMRMFIPKKA